MESAQQHPIIIIRKHYEEKNKVNKKLLLTDLYFKDLR